MSSTLGSASCLPSWVVGNRLAFLNVQTADLRHFVPGYYQPVPPGQKPLTHRAPRIKLALAGARLYHRTATGSRGSASLPKSLLPLLTSVQILLLPSVRTAGGTLVSQLRLNSVPQTSSCFA